MDRDSISSSAASPAAAFSLIEVIVAVGLVAVTIVALLALQGAVSRTVADVSGHDRAAQLTDAIEVELERLANEAVAANHVGRLDALAAIIPPGDSDRSLRLVAERDGLRVIRESDADGLPLGVAPRDRYYLLEVRQHSAPLAYTAGAGFLAVVVTIWWPYQLPGGAGGAEAAAADIGEASQFHLCAAFAP